MSLNLADLASLGPGVFDYLRTYIDNTLYGSWPAAFWTSSYCLAGLLGLILLTILSALIIKYRKDRLRWFVQDGAATRPDLRTFVPIAWSAYCILLIIHIFWLRNCIESRNFPPSLARFWWYEQSAMTFSYLVISTSIMASAPAVRRLLMRINGPNDMYTRVPPSTMLLLGSLGVVFLLSIAGITPPALMSADAFNQVRQAYSESLNLIDMAQSTGNVTALAGLVPLMADLTSAGSLNLRAQQVGGAVLSAYAVIHFATGIVPAIALNLFIKKRIAKLKRQAADRSATTMAPTAASLSPIRPNTNAKTVNITLPKPKDAPFSNTLPAGTGVVPPQFQTILDTKGHDPATRAQKLASALRQENRFVGSYCAALVLLSALAFFEAAGGQGKLTTTNALMVCIIWPAWSFTIPGMACAALLMWDALHDTNADALETNEAGGSGSSGSRSHTNSGSYKTKFHAPIQLTQTVQYTEEVELEKVSPRRFGESDEGKLVV